MNLDQAVQDLIEGRRKRRIPRTTMRSIVRNLSRYARKQAIRQDHARQLADRPETVLSHVRSFLTEGNTPWRDGAMTNRLRMLHNRDA